MVDNVEFGKIKIFLVAIIGLCAPIAQTGAFVDEVPRWLAIIATMLTSGAGMTLAYLVKPPKEEDFGKKKNPLNLNKENQDDY